MNTKYGDLLEVPVAVWAHQQVSTLSHIALCDKPAEDWPNGRYIEATIDQHLSRGGGRRNDDRRQLVEESLHKAYSKPLHTRSQEYWNQREVNAVIDYGLIESILVTRTGSCTDVNVHPLSFIPNKVIDFELKIIQL
eukprot:GILK01026337.1.p2 GENE.GILK01026337.1~~GILK01026337.1.p2  ORF type:complete len:137 (-),score=6.66 GILK01026337.1:244-654(-)